MSRSKAIAMIRSLSEPEVLPQLLTPLLCSASLDYHQPVELIAIVKCWSVYLSVHFSITSCPTVRSMEDSQVALRYGHGHGQGIFILAGDMRHD
jgi:hypothetical protein